MRAYRSRELSTSPRLKPSGSVAPRRKLKSRRATHRRLDPTSFSLCCVAEIEIFALGCPPLAEQFGLVRAEIRCECPLPTHCGRSFASTATAAHAPYPTLVATQHQAAGLGVDSGPSPRPLPRRGWREAGHSAQPVKRISAA
jgi:hypothetical protein